MQNKKEFVFNDFGEDPLKIVFSNLAEQANGSCLVQQGGTWVLVTAVMGSKDREGIDFFPLTVEYIEKFYATGKILGGSYMRREGRSSENAVLTGRIIDRSIRPLFDSHLRREVQIVATVLSIDGKNDPDILSLIGASLALGTSNIPWNGPVTGLRVGKNGSNEFKLNPSLSEGRDNGFDVFASITGGKINMVEVGVEESSEEEVIDAISKIVEWGNKFNDFQNNIISEIGQPKETIALKQIDPDFKKSVLDFLRENKLEEAVYAGDKGRMKKALQEVEKNLISWLEESELIDQKSDALMILEEEVDDIVHKNVLESEKRPDGRKLDEIRELHCEAGILPDNVHGSGVFFRGQTHALSAVTLASPSRALTVENIEVAGQKTFIHHYNFPPFSVGETGPFRGPGRREIGHGALAEKALQPVIPTKEEFPYAIRIVSEILSSNGSSSMASTCGSTIALMDAGVPIKKPVAGIAMGVIMKDENNYKVLTDIQGPEDHYGDMDFKAAGTKDGLTACQLDVKIQGITVEMVEKTLNQAKTARLQILEKISQAIAEPSKELSSFAPKISTISINPDKIGLVIGSGGRTINEIMDKTETQIDIDDDGSVYVTGLETEKVNEAIKTIEALTKEYSVGEIVEGKITRILDFGAILEFAPQKDGLIHISELAHGRTEKVEDVLKVDDQIKAKIIRIEDDKISLSIKALTPKPDTPKPKIPSRG